MNVDRECPKLDRPASTAAPTGHLPVLDGVRGVAALLVVFMHTTVIDHPSSFAERAVYRASTLGWVGVDLFFVLSGFLITGILANARRGERPLRNFFVRRALRIWPLYFAFLVGCLMLPPLASGRLAGIGRLSSWEWAAYWLNLGNLVPAVRGAMPPDCPLDVTWSLAVEEQFYLVWPFVVVLCSRRTALLVAAGAVLVAPLFRLGSLASGASGVALYVLTPCRIDALGAGSWVALTAQSSGGLVALRPAAGRVAAVTGVAVLALLTFLVANHHSFYQYEFPFQTVGYTLFAVLFAAILVRLTTAPTEARVRRLLSHPAAMAVGKYSYAIYLLHSPIRDGLRALGWGPPATRTTGSQLPAQFAFYVAVFATAFVAAWLSWHLLEKHFLRLKQWFPAEASSERRERRDALGAQPRRRARQARVAGDPGLAIR